MARILVAEDSPDQAAMVAGLLEAAGLTAEIATTGTDALAAVTRNPPDLVVTDLIMPGLNGLELVEAVKNDFPSIPVILMTAFGSGEIAAKALQKGAASYVPKRRIGDELVHTVETTLAVARAQREEERMLGCLVESEFRFVLDNDQTLIPPLVGYMQENLCARWKGYDENRLMQIGIALQEALLNAMHHGNLEVSSELRETDGAVYYRTLEQRRGEEQYRDRTVNLAVTLNRSEIVCVIRDEGPGFDPSEVPDPTDPANLEKVSGRGLYLIWTFMDQVSHNDRGNQITMVKRLPTE